MLIYFSSFFQIIYGLITLIFFCRLLNLIHGEKILAKKSRQKQPPLPLKNKKKAVLVLDEDPNGTFTRAEKCKILKLVYQYKKDNEKHPWKKIARDMSFRENERQIAVNFVTREVSKLSWSQLQNQYDLTRTEANLLKRRFSKK